MKKISLILLSVAAVLGIQRTASAQDLVKYELSPEGIGYSKVIGEPDRNGVYDIYLQSFVTGQKIVSQKSIPSDIVLVLDVSSSMINNNVNSYTYHPDGGADKSWTYDGAGTNHYIEYPTGSKRYHAVERERTGNSGNRRYHLKFTENATTHYLTADGIVDDRSEGVNSTTAPIWTGQLYTRTSQSVTRLKALQDAVGVFLDTIHENDIKNADGTPRTTPLGNKVSIVKFSGPYVGGSPNLEPGNHGGTTNTPTTEVFKGWTTMTEETVVEGLKTDVNALKTGQGTSIDYGMVLAKMLLDDLPAIDPENPRSKTVVVFTDGSPYRQASGESASAENIADAAINTANDIKGIKAYTGPEGEDVYTKIFTVGLLDSAPSAGSTVLAVLDRSSSNYKGATSRTTGERVSSAYYFLANDASSLTAIFASIGASSGGASFEMDEGTTALVDIVSNSFMLPPNADVNSIKVYTADCIGEYVGGDYDGLLKFQDQSLWADARTQGVQVTLSDNRQEVTVTHFDFSENWCGFEKNAQGLKTYRGKKIVLKIPIQMSSTAIGGKDLGTNAPGSGIIVNGQNILQFTSPEVSLPINIWIRKEGLMEGESAKFTIQRAVKPEAWYAEGFAYPENSSDNRYEALEWEDVSSIFVTRHEGQAISGENAPLTKAIGLPSVNDDDEEFIYRIIENEDWSWSYDSTTPTIFTSDLLEVNPFVFSNTLKSNIGVEVRHAESKATNTFKEGNFVVNGQVVKVVNSKHVSYDDSKTNVRP